MAAVHIAPPPPAERHLPAATWTNPSMASDCIGNSIDTATGSILQKNKK